MRDHVALSGPGAAEGDDGVASHKQAGIDVAQRSDAVHGRADEVALNGGQAAEEFYADSFARNHVAGRSGGAANRGRAADLDASAGAREGLGARRLQSAGNVGADEVALHRQTDCLTEDAADPAIVNHVASARRGAADQERTVAG